MWICPVSQKIDASQADMLSCCCFIHASFDLLLLTLNVHSALLCFLHHLLNPFVSFPVFFCCFCFIPPLLQISSLNSEVGTSLVIQGFLLRCSFPSNSMAVSVIAALLVIIMVSTCLSTSSSFRPISGANFPPIVARNVHATSGPEVIKFFHAQLS